MWWKEFSNIKMALFYFQTSRLNDYITFCLQFSNMSRGQDTQSRIVWDSSNCMKPCIITSINRMKLPFFCSATFPCLWFSSSAFSPGRPFLSPVSATPYIGRCASFSLCQICPTPTPVFQTTPLWSLYYWYNHFCFPSIPSLSTRASSLPNPISYICCPYHSACVKS